jgi:hypothetical protein
MRVTLFLLPGASPQAFDFIIQSMVIEGKAYGKKDETPLPYSARKTRSGGFRSQRRM